MTSPPPALTSPRRSDGGAWQAAATTVLALGGALCLFLMFSCLSGNAHLIGEKPLEVLLICVAAAGVPPLAIAFAGFRRVASAGRFWRGLAISLAAALAHVPFTIYAAHSDHGSLLAAGELLAGMLLALATARVSGGRARS